MDRLTVSLELVNPAAKRPLGLRIEKVVQRWVEKRDLRFFYDGKDLEELQKILLEETGMNIEFQIKDTPALNSYASVLMIPGHSGTAYFGIDTKPVTLVGDGLNEDLRKLTLNLDKGSVEGGHFIKDWSNRITITSGLIMDQRLAATVEEITSVILHEIGHVYNQFLALGDYVWLNYILQDGLEVLQGKKPNKYKLEVLTEKGLQKYCKDKDLAKLVRTEPTDSNLRRAILVASANAPRHYLSSQDVELSKVREEQMADLYASRMGYARAFVSLNVKADKLHGDRWTMSNARFMTGELIKVMTAIGGTMSFLATAVFPPAVFLGMAFIAVNRSLDYTESELYDNPLERMNKLRRDLVAQLRVLSKDKDMEAKLLEDIKAVDVLISNYRQHTTVWEALTTLLSPSTRRQRHQRAKEEQLERLLHNDLFVHAAKFNTLSRKA